MAKRNYFLRWAKILQNFKDPHHIFKCSLSLISPPWEKHHHGEIRVYCMKTKWIHMVKLWVKHKHKLWNKIYALVTRQKLQNFTWKNSSDTVGLKAWLHTFAASVYSQMLLHCELWYSHSGGAKVQVLWNVMLLLCQQIHFEGLQ